jgi:hypothetical protein
VTKEKIKFFFLKEIKKVFRKNKFHKDL